MVGLTLKRALKLELPIDPRRSTQYAANVEALKAYLSKGRVKPKKRIKPSEPLVAITAVKGIGQKRAEQLSNVRIDSANTLAQSAPQALAEKLGVAERTAARWVENAKQLLQR